MGSRIWSYIQLNAWYKVFDCYFKSRGCQGTTRPQKPTLFASPGYVYRANIVQWWSSRADDGTFISWKICEINHANDNVRAMNLGGVWYGAL